VPYCVKRTRHTTWCRSELAYPEARCAAASHVVTRDAQVGALTRALLGASRRMHVDAAYAGVAALLPEQRAGLDGLELADSFDTNCHKCARSGTRQLQSSAPLHSLTAFVCKALPAVAHPPARQRLACRVCMRVGALRACPVDHQGHSLTVYRKLAVNVHGCLQSVSHCSRTLLPSLGQPRCTPARRWLLVNFDCSCMWVRDAEPLKAALSLTPHFLRAKGNALDYKARAAHHAPHHAPTMRPTMRPPRAPPRARTTGRRGPRRGWPRCVRVPAPTCAWGCLVITRLAAGRFVKVWLARCRV